MTIEEKRKKIIDNHKEKRQKYTDEEIARAIKRTSGGLSALKDVDLDKVREEALLCK